ncbi:MAG TPA: hypothetical protein PKC55_10800 [Dysgonomonas sp.]|uniref:hypothetical protein n=1 Tax=unclassified Dysgonomonas TaxID=2630389 RepID=UPI0025BF79D3|nr:MULTISPECIES: hypothetical protein [unclassified Dysgonomonas]HML65308.1 hypothetical protein [Dysgonomonas sp.]
MENICTNIAVVTGTDKQVLEQVIKDISKNFECYTDIEIDNGCCELEFSTNGPFPREAMEAMTKKYPGKDLYIQVITYELPNELVQHHIYENGKWTDKLKEKYQQNN